MRDGHYAGLEPHIPALMNLNYWYPDVNDRGQRVTVVDHEPMACEICGDPAVVDAQWYAASGSRGWSRVCCEPCGTRRGTIDAATHLMWLTPAGDVRGARPSNPTTAPNGGTTAQADSNPFADAPLVQGQASERTDTPAEALHLPVPAPARGPRPHQHHHREDQPMSTMSFLTSGSARNGFTTQASPFTGPSGLSAVPETAGDLRAQAAAADALAEQLQLLMGVVNDWRTQLVDRLAGAGWGTEQISSAADALAGAGDDPTTLTDVLAGLVQACQDAIAVGAEAAAKKATGAAEAFQPQ